VLEKRGVALQGGGAAAERRQASVK